MYLPRVVSELPAAVQEKRFLAPSVDWRNDDCLATLGEVLSRPGLTHFSLDVFDTTLLRWCERPVDVFPVLGETLLERSLLPPAWTAEEFAEFRVEVEREARDSRRPRCGDGEVTLAEVYERACQTPGFCGHVKEYCELELEAEKRFCYANPPVVSLLKSLQARGLQVLFVSDTYLSRPALIGLLESCGVPTGNARAYVSCEMRAGKYDGRLFERVLEDEGIDAKAIFHVGDNEVSDCKGAASHGIGWQHYRADSDYLCEVVRRERELLQDNAAPAIALNDLRALAARQTRKVPMDEARFFRYGAAVLGPAISSFTTWAAHTFAAAETRHVLALMREGTLLGELLTESAHAADIELHAVPCHVSREAVALPAIVELDEPTLRRFWWRRDPPTLERLAISFKLDSRHLEHLNIDPRQPLAGEELRSRVIHALRSSPLRERIENSASHARQLLHKYLDDLVPLDERVGILDLGWNATIQKCLQRILSACGHREPLVGCYLGLVGRWSQMRIDGLAVHALLGSAEQSAPALPAILRSPEILEQSVNDNVGTTLGYEQRNGRVVPILGEFRCLPREAARRAAIRAGIRAFHRLYVQLHAARPELYEPAALPPAAVGAILKRLIDQPLPEEAFDLGSLHHDDNFGSDSWWPICDGYGESVLRAGGADALSSDFKVYWPQGVLAQHGVSGAASGNESDCADESSDLDVVQLSWSQDHTFATQAGSAQQVLRNGEAVSVRATIPADCRHLRLSPGAARALIYLDEWSVERLEDRCTRPVDKVYGEGLMQLDAEGRRWVAYRDMASLAALLPETNHGQCRQHRQVVVRLRRLAVKKHTLPA